MPRPRRNPFDLVLGLVGFLFVVTAASYCVTVLRGVRPAGDVAPHPLDRFMADHGTTALVVELVLLAVAPSPSLAVPGSHTYADVCRRMLTYLSFGYRDILCNMYTTHCQNLCPSSR